MGGSITNQPSWADNVVNTITFRELDRDVRLYADRANGKTAWDHANTFQTTIIDQAPHVIVLEHAANNRDENIYKFVTEANIRRIRTALPNAWIIMATFGYWTDGPLGTTVSNGAVITFLQQLAVAYDCEIWDTYGYLKALVDAGGTLDTWHTSPDYVHPDTAGDVLFGTYLDALLSSGKLDGTAPQWTGDLGDYAYINAEAAQYESGWIVRTGIDNDGETGTGWSTSGTARISSTANDTISWTGTFTCFGVDVLRQPGQGVVGWSLDGGAYTNIDLNNYVVYPQLIQHIGNPAAAHTVTFKVISGSVRFNRFLAI